MVYCSYFACNLINKVLSFLNFPKKKHCDFIFWIYFLIIWPRQRGGKQMRSQNKTHKVVIRGSRETTQKQNSIFYPCPIQLFSLLMFLVPILLFRIALIFLIHYLKALWYPLSLDNNLLKYQDTIFLNLRST